jgi:hypothetical protein
MSFLSIKCAKVSELIPLEDISFRVFDVGKKSLMKIFVNQHLGAISTINLQFEGKGADAAFDRIEKGIEVGTPLIDIPGEFEYSAEENNA